MGDRRPQWKPTTVLVAAWSTYSLYVSSALATIPYPPINTCVQSHLSQLIQFPPPPALLTAQFALKCLFANMKKFICLYYNSEV